MAYNGCLTATVILSCSFLLLVYEAAAATAAIPLNVDIEFPIHMPPQRLVEQIRNANSQVPSLAGASVVAVRSTSQLHNLYFGVPNLITRSSGSSALQSGAIFSCTIDSTNVNDSVCNLINMSNVPIPGNGEYVPRNRSLLGLVLSENHNSIIACAPNWVSKHDTPEGLCFLIDGKTSAAQLAFKFEPNPNNRVRKNRPYDSHTLFGSSVVYNEITNEIIVGTPGFGDFSGWVSLVNTDFQAERMPLPEKSNVALQANGYKGYAVATIVAMTTDGAKSIVVLGAPRNENFLGKVELIDPKNGQRIFTLNSPNKTLGDYFGASLLVINQPNNEKQLLVGAPLYWTSNKRDVGRVYLYRHMETLIKRPTTSLIIEPKSGSERSRFGITLASMNFNNDEWTDIVIGAPFEDNQDGSSGAIYIFYGDESGFNLHSEQKIIPSSFTKNSLGGFGYGLWTQSDIDSNGYNDLIVSSLLSESISILRLKPVVTLNLTVDFDRKGINLTDSNGCSQPGSACFRMNYCILTNSKQNFPDDVEFDVHFIVSDRKLRLKEKRTVGHDLITKIRTNQKKICVQNEQAIYVEIKKKEEIYDIITPLEVQLSVKLNKSESLQFCSWCPVASSVTTHKEIGFEHGCAQKQCVAKLDLEVHFKYGPKPISNTIVQGRFSNIEIQIIVSNYGESSIDTVLTVSMAPTSLMLKSTETRCTSLSNENEVSCDVNKLLLKNHKEQFKLHFDLDEVSSKEMHFALQLNSSSQMSNEGRKAISKHFSIVKEATFRILDNTQYSNTQSSNYSFSKQTPDVLFHIPFIVEKSGPSSVKKVYIQFDIPSDTVVMKGQQNHCKSIKSNSQFNSPTLPVNGTINLSCTEQPNKCHKYECNLGAFGSDSKSVDLDLALVLQSNKISSKLDFSYISFLFEANLFVEDTFFDKQKPQATLRTEIIFENRFTEIESKASPLIMFAGGGVGLLLILITFCVLLKSGFFRRKKREELLRVKQRMSLNPNLVLPNFGQNKGDDGEDENEDDDDDDNDNTNNSADKRY